MLQELNLKNIRLSNQKTIHYNYKGIELESELRFDILVENLIVVELKSVEFINPLYEAQLLTYMKLLEKPKGILINFNCLNIFKEGQKTFVNEFYRNFE